MSEQTEVNNEVGAVDIVGKINDNQRASAIDAIHDMLFSKASEAMADYKKVVSLTHSLTNLPKRKQPMKLITETIEDVRLLTEEKDGKKLLYIEGVFLQSELKNRNGRMYPFSVLEREVKRYNEEYVQSKRALGELGHPDGPTINLDRVSHRITSLKAEGNNFIGKAQILDTPMGNIAKNLLGEGVQLGVSSRGMGSIQKVEDCNVVADDFMLTTAADIVADPSAPDAFVNGIMEGKEWVWDNGLLKEKEIAKYQRYMDEATRRTMEEKTLKVFEHFLSNL